MNDARKTSHFYHSRIAVAEFFSVGRVQATSVCLQAAPHAPTFRLVRYSPHARRKHGRRTSMRQRIDHASVRTAVAQIRACIAALVNLKVMPAFQSRERY